MNELHESLTVLPNAVTSTLTGSPKRTNQSFTPSKQEIPWEVDGVDELICFSHLRWNFVYQRPQHLLSRASRQCRVWYVEEPIWGNPAWNGLSGLETKQVSPRLTVVVPHLPHGLDPNEVIAIQQTLIDELLEQKQIENYAVWYYTPMALPFSDHLKPRFTVYDCMDELSAFLGAPAPLIEMERRLLQRADVVFTGGYSLYEAKQKRHPKVFAFPSCIDYDHFSKASAGLPDPADQAAIAGPRIGYSGVIDERLDLKMIGELAQQQPGWQFIFVGPVVKVNPDSLPQAPNIHYLGMKPYEELPAYFSNWQVAMMPFAINEATRFISPTKTPEYLAAGLPVISTPVCDVVRSYGYLEQVVIADSVAAFQRGISLLLRHPDSSDAKLEALLRERSWDNTWQQMQRIMMSQLMQAGFEQ